MSLSNAERLATSQELQENLLLSDLTNLQVATDLGYSLSRLAATVALSAGNDPADVWQLRDYLQQAVRDSGVEAAPFTVLTEQSRSAAQRWFGLRQAPRRGATRCSKR